MKTWNTPVMEELNISCTEKGSAFATVVDDVRVDQNGNNWYSFSGAGEPADKPIIDPLN